MAVTMKDIKFGIEIETVGRSRAVVAQAIQKVVGGSISGGGHEFHVYDDRGLEWKVVQDEGGTEMAVWGKVGDVLVFPANLVGKRYVARTTDFFEGIASQISDRVRQVQGQSPAEPRSGVGRFFRRGGQ